LSLADELVRLQPLVGNTAVTALISRALLQRDGEPSGEALPLDARDEPKSGSTFTMEMSGIGSFVLLSLQFPGAQAGQSQRVRPKETEKEKKKPEGPKEILVTRNQDRFSAEFLRRAGSGQTIDTVTVVARKGEKVMFTLTLTNVVISNVQVSERGDRPIETVSLSAESSEIEFPEAGPK
jgi:hypothetical protein